MILRFILGAFCGVVLVVSGMIAGSALFPPRGLSEMPSEASTTKTAEPEAVPVDVAVAAPPAVEPDLTEAAPDVTETPALLPKPADEAEATDILTAAEVEAPAMPEAPAALPAPGADRAVAAADSGKTAAAPVATPLPATEPAAAQPAAQPAAKPAPATEPAPQPLIVTETEPAPQPGTGPGSGPGSETAPEPAAPPAVEAQPGAAVKTEAAVEDASGEEDAKSSTFAPSKGFASTGTIITDTADSAGDIAAADPAATMPMALYAAKFDNPLGKPVLAVVLIDSGAADLDRAGLAALPFPVSFALDPMDPATPDHAAIYRAAGREVIMLATGIAEGAQASDIEVAFQSMSLRLPEAVAVMDLSEPVFQDNRPLASLVVPVIGGEGRGVLSWDKGLNAADQVARRDDIASAVIFRDLAMGGGDAAAAKRTLDRAVLKAGQDGRVVVAGQVTDALISALLEWSVEGRAGAVALAPLTAALKVD